MFRISIHILYFAFVSAIGRRSFTVFFVVKQSLMYFRMLVCCFLYVLFLVHCVSLDINTVCVISKDLYKFGLILWGPANLFSFIFFICCVESFVVICGSSMYPIYLTFDTIS